MSKKGMRVSPIKISVIPEPFGRRLWKEVNRVRTYYFYSDDGLIGKYDSNGNEFKTYGHAPHFTWTTNPLFQKIVTNYYWYQNDHLGTPQKIVDASARVVWTATDDSFGKAQIQVSEIENNLRFPGQYYGQEPGLHYNWHRYYDPKTGRYLTPDPIGLEGGINLFAYARNNPLRFLDPGGMDECDDKFWDFFNEALKVDLECMGKVAKWTLTCMGGCLSACLLSGYAFPACLLFCETICVAAMGVAMDVCHVTFAAESAECAID